MNRERGRRALITRPQEDAAALAVALDRRGITPMLAPMMQTKFFPLDISADVGRAQAMLFTSRNGVRAFSRVSDRRDVKVFAVGDSTANLAGDAGFFGAESAGGDSADLARLVVDRLSPTDGPVLHIAGKTIAGDLSGTLSADGFEVIRHTLYEARPVRALTQETAGAIRSGEIDYVLFFSPRTARVFSDLVAAAELTAHCRNFEAICLSEAVAAELPSVNWKVRRTATVPTSEALLDAVDTAAGVAAPGADAARSTGSPVSESPSARETANPEPDASEDAAPIDLAPLTKAIKSETALAESPRPEPDDEP